MADVVHFLHALNDRTIADVVCCLGEQMRRAGRDTVIVARHVTVGARRPDGVRVIDLGRSGRSAAAASWALRRVLKALRPAVVYAHAEGPARIAVGATRALRHRPTVVGVSHNHYSTYPWSRARVRRRLDALMLPKLDAWVGVSPGVALDLVATFPAAADRIHMIPPPLTRWERLEELAAEPIEHPFIGGVRPLLVNVSHMHPRKDHETLVRAIGDLRERMPNPPRLMIIGSDDGEHAERVRRLIDVLGLAEDIALLGSRANPMPYVAAADAFVLSSRNEGLPIVLMEAMGLGTPVVSTDAHSGPRWGLEDGKSGLLTPIGDASALAAAIHEMLADKDLSQRLATAARHRAERFVPSRIAGEYLALSDTMCPPGSRE